MNRQMMKKKTFLGIPEHSHKRRTNAFRFRSVVECNNIAVPMMILVLFKHFKSIFPRHAHVFKDHEIDGPSLYLLKRKDIIRGFNIEIGPALKLYNHILMMQTKSRDPTRVNIL